MSPVNTEGVFSYFGVAANEDVDPARVVIVGGAGIILYSTRVEEDEDGFETYVFNQVSRFTYNRFNGIDFGEGRFVTVGDAGTMAYSSGGSAWIRLPVITDENLYDVCYVGSSIWVAVGANGTVAKSIDNGLTWVDVTVVGLTENLNAIAAYGSDVVAVGDDGAIIVSDNSGVTWFKTTAPETDSMRGVVWNNDLTTWVIVGHGSLIMKYDGADPGTFDIGNVAAAIDFEGVAWAGTGGILIAVGSGSSTATSENGINWTVKVSGATAPVLYGVEYLDDRFVTVGAGEKVAYSASGAGVRAFDLFRPVSEIYRSVAFARFGGYMLYLGMYEFEGGAWTYYPRRIRNASPGTVNDFDEDAGFGAYHVDLPGDGAIIAAASIEGGIVVGEQNQISLLTDGGSLITPWDYHDNYGEGLTLISNLTTFGGAAFGICTDGLIYRADYNSVQRIQSFFDLTKFDDFNPGSERVSIQFDPATQKLVVFRPASPWVIYLCDDESGSLTEFHLPEFFDGHSTYTPMSVFVPYGEIGGLKVGYGTDDAAMDEVVTLELQMDAGATGFDVSDPAPAVPYAGEIVTGCFRMTNLGVRGDMREILVRTTCDTDATARPRVAIGIKSEPEDDWKYSPQVSGTFVADGVSGEITGTKTAMSNRIAEADGVTLEYDVPWLVEKITSVYTKHTVTDAITTMSYTKSATRKILLASVIPASEELYVHAVGMPQVVGSAGDLVELTNGELHIIDEISDATTAVCSSLSADYSGAATYIPTKEMPEGDDYGDGKLTFGLGKGFDQLMLRFIMVAGIDGDAKFAKIKKIEVGYEPTGPELKTDE